MKYILISFLLLAGCMQEVKQESKIELDASLGIIETYPYEVLSDSIIEHNIGGSAKLSFKFNVDSTGYFLKSIIIYKNNNKYQVIRANKDIQYNDFRLIDWNFDGFKDITVLYNCGSGGCAYWIWNYSDKTKKYYYNSELSGILGLEIDSISEYIIFHYRNGWPEEYWDSLKYINNKLTYIKGLYVESWTDTNINYWERRTHKSIVNNRLVTDVDSPIIIKE